MKKYLLACSAGAVAIAIVMVMSAGGARAGTWRAVTEAPFYASNGLLLMNGDVMVQELGSADWYLLKPDAHGNYVTGTWQKIASLPKIKGTLYAPEYYASAVLPDGKVLIMGGEYISGDGVWSNLGALYDPATNKWTAVSPPKDSGGPWPHIGDAASVVLPDGTFMLQCGYCGGALNSETALFDEATLKWTVLQGTGMAYPYQDEQGWTLLPDGTVLTVDIWDTKLPKHAEKFVYNAASPSLSKWVSAGNTPVPLTGGEYASTQCGGTFCPAYEVGPAVLRPDGTVIAFGATGYNAIYTPGSTPTAAGSWKKGPTFPQYSDVTSSCWQGTPRFDVADGPATLLLDGNVLVAASPGVYCMPTRFYELDLSDSKLHLQPSPPNAAQVSSYGWSLLVLPTGQILVTNGSTDVEVYTAAGTSNSAWAPVITGVPKTVKRGTAATLSGKYLNGWSQGAMYGDDEQMATNYPLVRLVNGTKVYYCTAANPSSMAVANAAKTTVQFTCPTTIPAGSYNLEVVANGIASAPVAVTAK